MSLYWDGDARVLKAYLDKCDPKERKSRPISADEVEYVGELWKLRKELNVLITELLTIIMVVNQLNDSDDSDLGYIASNLRIMMASAQKQRDFILALSLTFSSIKPNGPELRGIKRTISRARRRMDYVRSTAVPMNLELTPLKEYLEIIGKQGLIDDLYEQIGDVKEMVGAGKDKNLESINRYAKRIIDTVSKAGKASDYKGRLSEYVERRKRKKWLEETEKAEEKHTLELEEAKEGVMEFCRMFEDAVRSLSGNPEIQLNPITLSKTIDKRGRDCYFVLCCYFKRQRRYYRYLSSDDQFAKSFSAALAFKNEYEAMVAKKRIEDKYPTGAFEIVSLKIDQATIANPET